MTKPFSYLLSSLFIHVVGLSLSNWILWYLIVFLSLERKMWEATVTQQSQRYNYKVLFLTQPVMNPFSVLKIETYKDSTFALSNLPIHFLHFYSEWNLLIKASSVRKTSSIFGLFLCPVPCGTFRGWITFIESKWFIDSLNRLFCRLLSQFLELIEKIHIYMH